MCMKFILVLRAKRSRQVLKMGPLIHVLGLSFITFVFACISSAYGSIGGFLMVLWQGEMCLAKVPGRPAKVRPVGLQPQQNTRPELVIFITFTSEL